MLFSPVTLSVLGFWGLEGSKTKERGRNHGSSSGLQASRILFFSSGTDKDEGRLHEGSSPGRSKVNRSGRAPHAGPNLPPRSSNKHVTKSHPGRGAPFKGLLECPNLTQRFHFHMSNGQNSL